MQVVMYKNTLLKLQIYNIYITRQPLLLQTQLVSNFFVGLLADYLLIRLYSVVVGE